MSRPAVTRQEGHDLLGGASGPPKETGDGVVRGEGDAESGMGQAYAGNPASLGVGCGIWLSGSGTVVLTTSTTGSPHMRDLRLIGVHEDGQHLLLANADGGRFRLPLDEALRAAARRDRPRLGQLQIEIEGGLRPRDVQALIRRGLSAEEVADRAGWTVEKVRRFEGPVLAEREYVAAKARQCAVGSRGNGPLTLADRVADRLKDRGVERDAVDWDSARATRRAPGS